MSTCLVYIFLKILSSPPNWMGPQWIFSNAIYFLCIPVPASGLRDLKVYIPDTVLRGHNIHFNCTFTLEDEKLFAIKWYRGNYEIFRYMPSSNAPKKTFPLEGYNVSVSSLLFQNVKSVGVKMKKAILRQSYHTRQRWKLFFWTQKLQICQFAVERSLPKKKALGTGFITTENVGKPLFKDARWRCPRNGREIYAAKSPFSLDFLIVTSLVT